MANTALSKDTVLSFNSLKIEYYLQHLNTLNLAIYVIIINDCSLYPCKNLLIRNILRHSSGLFMKATLMCAGEGKKEQGKRLRSPCSSHLALSFFKP